MASSGMLRCLGLVRTYVSEDLSASMIRVPRIGELGKTLAVTSNRTLHSYHIQLIFIFIELPLCQILTSMQNRVASPAEVGDSFYSFLAPKL
jgi:hypothetical protein